MIHPRADWQTATQPVTGPPQVQALISAIVWHWPGGLIDIDEDNDGDSDETDAAAHLRRGQAGYLATRGYSYGYNWVIWVDGSVWEVRGSDINCAANGPSTWNARAVAVQIAVRSDAHITPAQIRAAQDLAAHLETLYRRPLPHLGHRQVRSQTWPNVANSPSQWTTSCPGDEIAGLVEAGAFKPRPLPPPDPVPPTPDPTPDPNPEEESMFPHLFLRCRVNDTTNAYVIYAVWNGFVTWMRSHPMIDALQARAAAAGRAPIVEETTTDRVYFQSFGPIVGTHPPGTADDGWPVV